MTPVFEKGELLMLEDFIRLAKEGKTVEVKVELRKQDIAQRVHPAGTEERKAELDAYLLIGDYTCSVEGEIYEVPKVYIYGSAQESLHTGKINKNITNERLKRDYRRLQDANIRIDEKYF